MIKLENVHKTFGKLTALNDINLTLNTGECVALVGPNGCGKTTLIKSILGMVVPSHGDILLKGKSIRNDVSYKHHIGYMPQIGRYPEQMSIGQIFDMVIELRASTQPLDRELFEAYDLKNLLDKKMRTLSGGTTQKVSAALAFLFNPDILILDEPTAGLDPLASDILKEKIIKEKANGKLILITSHLLSELNDLVTQLVFMQDGQIKLHQNIDDLKASTQTQTLSKAITQLLKNMHHV